MSKVNNKVKRNIKEFIHNIFTVLRKPEMIILPGSLSFFFVLAVMPTLSLICYGASSLNLSVDYIYNFLATSFSKEIADIILGVQLTNNGIGFIITIIVGLYVASNGADSIIMNSNTIYGIKNKGWFKRRFKALLMTFIIIILLLFILIVPLFGETIISLIKEVNLNTNITNKIIDIFNLIKGPIEWLIIFIIIKIIYVIAPDKRVKSRYVNYGAIFTTVLWIIGTKIYSLYVMNYANYANLYGGIANVVVLMVWVYYLSYIFTIGMCLNYERNEILPNNG